MSQQIIQLKTNLSALVVHYTYSCIPFCETLSIVIQVIAGDGHFARDNRMDSCTSVSNHKNSLGIWEQFNDVGRGLEREWIFVAIAFGRAAVTSNYLNSKSG
jgi:hypothetical protein